MEFLRTHKLITTALFAAIASIIYNLLTPIWYSYCSSLDYSSYINIIYNSVPTLLFATLLFSASTVYIKFILKKRLRIWITILLSIPLSLLFLFVIRNIVRVIFVFFANIIEILGEVLGMLDLGDILYYVFLDNLLTPLSFLACIYIIMLVHCPPTTPEQAATGSGYRSMAKHVLLLIFTFGIYNLIWIYRTTAYLNQVNDEPPRNPTYKLLLCLFVPFYEVYWVYKSSQRIDRLAGSKGIHSNISTLCTVLAIFLWIVPPIIMQDKINTVEKPPLSTPPVQHTDVADELKKYKELLDMGAISQDEFDKKKQQLLNL